MKKLMMIMVAAAMPMFVTAEEPASREEVQELINLSMEQLGSMQEQMKDYYRMMAPEMTDEAWSSVWKDLSVWVENLQTRLVDVYVKTYSKQDVQDLLTFYRSPVGKKMIEKQPELMQEIMTTLGQWSEEVGPKLQERILAETNLQEQSESVLPEAEA